jgi:septal ring factor EnvC (AmiA/AmiB activator)
MGGFGGIIYMKMKNRVFLLTLIIPLILLSISAQAQQDVTEYEKRLKQIETQISSLKNKINKAQKRETSILSTLSKIGLEKKLIINELSLYNTQADKANSELKVIRNKIPLLKASLAQDKKSIEKILVNLYKHGHVNYFGLLLQVQDMGNLISENKNLTRLAEYQNDIITDYIRALSELRTAERQQALKKSEVTQLLQKASRKKRELEAQERKNRAFINDITRNKNTYTETLKELEGRSQELHNFVQKLLRNEISLPFLLIPLYESKGNLAWPILGEVVTYFGLQKHPVFQTVTQNNGIEIASESNKMIRSVHPGLVVFNDYFQGYGNLIIIDHGLSYYTLYGHCAEFFVKKGDTVQAGDVIARVGETDSLKGISLYFEIRHKTEPLNPLQWLKRR